MVLLGPPGVGKGTQASRLETKLNACIVSTGDILRDAMREGTPLGREAESFVTKGRLVPDKLMLSLVGERLTAADCRNGFILDGFPRTLAQADGLQEVLSNRGTPLDFVFYIEVPEDVILKRLVGRRTCKSCGTVYHVDFNRSKREGRCDRCGGELYLREDDKEETIAERLSVYEVETVPLIEYYRRKGLIRHIDGVGTVTEIERKILSVLEESLG
jgi:adenylate kinase